MTQQVTWRVIGKSVRGASHIRTGLPNQDALRWLPDWGEGPPLILAVSDGHGSAKCFRSAIGSELAVKNAVWLLQDLLDGQLERANLSSVKRTAEERLPREMVRRWRDSVAQHYNQYPFTDEELEMLECQRDASSRGKLERHPELAYGATILAVLVTSEFTLYFQLGDGDILTVSPSGDVARPMPEDARLIANETTSLCGVDAWREVRFRFEVNNELPAAILVASDGYGNSYVNDTSFFQVGTDLLDMLRANGPDYIDLNIEDWLNEASAKGSGDDISLGMLYNTDALNTNVTDSSDDVNNDRTVFEEILADEDLLDYLAELAVNDQIDANKEKDLADVNVEPLAPSSKPHGQEVDNAGIAGTSQGREKPRPRNQQGKNSGKPMKKAKQVDD